MINFLVKHFIKADPNTPKGRQRVGMLSGFTGIFLNLVLFAAKFLAGTLTASIAITADAFNNLSDAGSSIITLVGFKMAGAPADTEHPFGHGRIEYISGLIVSLIIIMMGFELLKSSIEKIITPEAVAFHMLSVIILVVSICVKGWMCLFNRKLGGLIGSAAMQATAMDSLSDVAATSAVLIGTLIGAGTGWALDGYLGVVVALFIMYTGFSTAGDTLRPLLGKVPDREFVEEIYQTVMAYDDVVGVHDLVVHDYGPGRCMISLHAEVPCDADILKMHDIIDMIEHSLHEKFQCNAVIHMDPIVTDDEVTNKMHRRVVALVQQIDKSLSVHDFRMVQGPTHTNLIFDVVIPFNFKMKDNEVVEAIQRGVQEMEGHTYYAVVNVDKSYV